MFWKRKDYQTYEQLKSQVDAIRLRMDVLELLNKGSKKLTTENNATIEELQYKLDEQKMLIERLGYCKQDKDVKYTVSFNGDPLAQGSQFCQQQMNCQELIDNGYVCTGYMPLNKVEVWEKQKDIKCSDKTKK